MTNFSQIKRISKLRPLSAKEKAVLCFWNVAEGRFINNSPSVKLSEILSSYQEVYHESEIAEIITPMKSDEEYHDFERWLHLINMTLDYDLTSQIFINKAFGLINEKSFAFYKGIHQDQNQDIYSIILDKMVTIQEIDDEITIALFMFYRFVISILVNHILLSNAFSLEKDMHCIKSLIHLTNIRKQIDIQDMRTNLLTNLMQFFQEEKLSIIMDHLAYVSDKSPSEVWWILNNDIPRDRLVDLVTECFEQYYPTKPVGKSHENEIFSELKELTQSDI